MSPLIKERSPAFNLAHRVLPSLTRIIQLARGASSGRIWVWSGVNTTGDGFGELQAVSLGWLKSGFLEWKQKAIENTQGTKPVAYTTYKHNGYNAEQVSLLDEAHRIKEEIEAAILDIEAKL